MMKALLAGIGLVMILLTLIIYRVTPVGGQEPAVPKLFANSYQAGHALAGFSGRPMVLVFGDSRVSGWNEFLIACESDPDTSRFLQQNFIGVFVDAASEPQIFAEYAVETPGTLLVKDLRGPLLGLLEPPYSCKDLLDTLSRAIPFLNINRSYLYNSLLRSPEILEQLVVDGDTELAENAVRFLRKFEPGSEALSAAERKASELGLSP